jgi:hypothetical protein
LEILLKYEYDTTDPAQNIRQILYVHMHIRYCTYHGNFFIVIIDWIIPISFCGVFEILGRFESIDSKM